MGTNYYLHMPERDKCDHCGRADEGEVITNRSWNANPRDQKMLSLSRAEIGPNNLLRSRVDGVNCIGHGEGTWDLIAGEFS